MILIQSRDGDCRVAFRVTDMPRWLRFLSSYLAREDRDKWQSFMGEKYILHNGKLAKVWVWMIDAPKGISLTEAAAAACLCLTATISQTSTADDELLSVEPVTIAAAWALGPQHMGRIANTKGGAA